MVRSPARLAVNLALPLVLLAGCAQGTRAAPTPSPAAPSVQPTPVTAQPGDPTCHAARVVVRGKDHTDVVTLTDPAGATAVQRAGATGLEPGAVLVDGTGLALSVADGQVRSQRPDATLSSWAAAAPVKDAGTDVEQLLPLGRGAYYARHRDGSVTLHVVSTDGTRAPINRPLAQAKDWKNYAMLAGGGEQTVWARTADGVLSVLTRTDPPKPVVGGPTFSARPVTGGPTDVAQLAGIGDGVLLTLDAQGTLSRWVLAKDATTLRGGPVASDPGWAGATLTADPQACAPTAEQVRQRIIDTTLAWVGTGKKFCQGHDCYSDRWCLDLSFAVWADNGIVGTDQFKSRDLLSIQRYGEALGTLAPWREAELGDILVWGPEGKYFGHNSIVTKVYRDAGGKVTALDFANGNMANDVNVVVRQDPDTWAPTAPLGKVDTIVKPRL